MSSAVWQRKSTALLGDRGLSTMLVATNVAADVPKTILESSLTQTEECETNAYTPKQL